MRRTPSPLLLACVLPLLASSGGSCNSESTSCSGTLVGNQCFPCDGIMVDGTCRLDDGDVRSNTCKSDKQCLPAGVCIDGHCGQECIDSIECPFGKVCLKYRCVPDGDGDVLSDTGEKIPCDKHLDCDPYEMACIDGYCGRECTKDWHCGGTDARCVGYRCTGGASDVVSDGSSPQDVQEEELPPGCDPVAGVYRAACSCEQECTSSLCIFNNVSSSGMCTQYCQNDAQCPGSDVCIPLDQAAICILNDSGVETSCDPDQAFCYKGTFLKSKIGKCACATPCTKAVDCPEGFACHLVGADKYCVSTGGACSTQYNPCYGECAGNPNTGVGFCTGLCVSSADCPEGWTCQNIGQGVQVCAMPF